MPKRVRGEGRKFRSSLPAFKLKQKFHASLRSLGTERREKTLGHPAGLPRHSCRLNLPRISAARVCSLPCLIIRMTFWLQVNSLWEISFLTSDAQPALPLYSRVAGLVGLGTAKRMFWSGSTRYKLSVCFMVRFLLALYTFGMRSNWEMPSFFLSHSHSSTHSKTLITTHTHHARAYIISSLSLSLLFKHVPGYVCLRSRVHLEIKRNVR